MLVSERMFNRGCKEDNLLSSHPQHFSALPHHVNPLSSSSNILMYFQEFRGLPLLHFPCSSQLRAVMDTVLSYLLSLWPIHLHVHPFVSSSIGFCTACFHSSSFGVLLGHRIHIVPLTALVNEHRHFLLQFFGKSPRALHSHLT